MDYRALNKITIKNRYTVSRIADLPDQSKHAKYLTKLDLTSGYSKGGRHTFGKLPSRPNKRSMNGCSLPFPPGFGE